VGGRDVKRDWLTDLNAKGLRLTANMSEGIVNLRADCAYKNMNLV